MNPEQNRQILSVSQLNRTAKNLLDTYLPILWVEGEVSNFSRPSSGHWYFTLKDAKAQVRCAMFKNRNTSVKLTPKQGDKILLRAKVSLYEGRGDYQLIAEHLEPAGFGQLQAQFEALKNKLHQEGLFADSHKQPLPAAPQTLGVITSPTGAAITDILKVLQRRAPGVAVRLIPVAVQGDGAAMQIADAVALANQHVIADLLIVGRGGGSLEDLWAFNEEVVARAIFQSRIPIISAVGHEVDVSIADFTADVRAPTPSAAAELAVSDQQQQKQHLAQITVRLGKAIHSQIQAHKSALQHLKQRLRHPGEKIAQQAQQLDGLEMRLRQAIRHAIANQTHAIQTLAKRLSVSSPVKSVSHGQERISQAQKRLQHAVEILLTQKQQKLKHQAGLLHSLSPLSTLERGYAIVLDNQQKAVTNSLTLKKGDLIEAKLYQGTLTCTVETIKPD